MYRGCNEFHRRARAIYAQIAVHNPVDESRPPISRSPEVLVRRSPNLGKLAIPNPISCCGLPIYTVGTTIASVIGVPGAID